jgi:hypothetical protein
MTDYGYDWVNSFNYLFANANITLIPKPNVGCYDMMLFLKWLTQRIMILFILS